MPVMIANAHNTGWLTSKDVGSAMSREGAGKECSSVSNTLERLLIRHGKVNMPTEALEELVCILHQD
jgi:hypothetical protein